MRIPSRSERSKEYPLRVYRACILVRLNWSQIARPRVARCRVTPGPAGSPPGLCLARLVVACGSYVRRSGLLR